MNAITDIYRWFNHPVMLIVLIVFNLPLYKFLAETILGANGGIRESFTHWITPDMTSILKGEWVDHQWAEIKLGFFIVACVLCVAAEYTGLSKLIAFLSK